jgi:hypothetical protein
VLEVSGFESSDHPTYTRLRGRDEVRLLQNPAHTLKMGRIVREFLDLTLFLWRCEQQVELGRPLGHAGLFEAKVCF